MEVNKGSWTGVNVLVTDMQNKPEYPPNDGLDRQELNVQIEQNYH